MSTLQERAQREFEQKKRAARLRENFPTLQAKSRVLTLIQQGKTREQAMAAVGRGVKTFENWQAEDAEFKREVARIRAAHSGDNLHNRKNITDFASWRKKYLKVHTYSHQLQWIDLIEGREPRDLHESMTYVPGRKTRLLVNTPPYHAKSTTLTMDYATYRICKDPGIKIIVVSKTLDLAKKFLHGIKYRLTNPAYMDLQTDFAPNGSFKEDSAGWRQDQIYVAGREDGEKDPTVQALGMGGAIYGSRADLIIVDDAVDLKNAHEWGKQLEWIRQEVLSRTGPMRPVIVVGTRVASKDLYSELLNDDNYGSRGSEWTYFAQPAVLEFAEDPKDWVTLWPRSLDGGWEPDDAPAEDGTWPRWDGETLDIARGDAGDNGWARAWMQKPVSEDQTFKPEVLRKCQDARPPGHLPRGFPGLPEHGMAGMYVIAGLDPAAAGFTAFVVEAVDRYSGFRYVVDIKVQRKASPAWIRQTIKDITDEYRVNEWRIEANAFQRFLTQDEDIRQYLSSRGVLLSEHYTTRMNRPDPEMGIASMAPTFEAGLIRLPRFKSSEAVRQLVEQLIAWEPREPGKRDTRIQDIVMALWFCELRARELIHKAKFDDEESFMPNRFLSDRQRRSRQVVDLTEFAERMVSGA